MIVRHFSADLHVFVFQVHFAKRVFTHQVMQLGAGMCPQRLAVAQQEVERAVLRDSGDQLAQGQGEFFDTGHAGV